MSIHRVVVCWSCLACESALQADREAFLSMRTWSIFIIVWSILVYGWEGGVVPQPRGVPLGPKFQGLSLFGEWLVTLCDVLNTSQTEIAREAGINASTLSFNTRDVRPRYETVQKLWQVIRAIAQERGIAVSYYVEIGFFNAADYAAPDQSDLSRSLLEMFKDDHGIGDKQEVERLRAQLQEKEERIRELEAQNKRP